MESIVTAIIVGGLSLVGVVFTSTQNSKQIENKLATSQAVTDAKLQSLTDEVKRHNEFWMKVPVIEAKLEKLERDVDEIQRQLDNK